MKQEILVKLKQAEVDTAQRVEKAKARAADLIKQARREADELRREAETAARRDQEAQIAAERARLAKERERILSEGKAKDSKLRAYYEANVDAHVKRALGVFARSVNA